MAKEFGRNRRVADLIQRELANLMERDRDGSESTMVTISNVDVSPDLKNAKIYITCMTGEADAKTTITSLTENVGHYRHHMAHSLNLRAVPKLKFFYDHQLDRANRVNALIDTLADEGPGTAASDDPAKGI